MRLRVSWSVLVGTLLAANAGAAGSAAVQTGGAGPFAGALPATFAGDLPCADCPGVRHTVELHPENAFVYRRTYAGRGDGRKGESRDDLGRWAISADGLVLTLRGGREAPVMFEVKDARTLRKLDVDGRPIVSALNYTLTRATVFDPLQPRLELRGMYAHLADTGIFVECETGWRLPVAMEGDNAALERGYLAVRQQPGEPVLVSLDGQLAMRPRMEGAGLQRSLVPVRFIKAWSGATCQSSGGAVGLTSLAGTGWQFVSSTLKVPAPPEVAGIGLTFTDTVLSAASGCNRGPATYKIEGGALVAPTFATTMMACLGPVAKWESVFFKFLSSKPALRRDGDVLVLTSPEGEMRFRSKLMPSAAAVQKFIYVASERKPCAGMAPTSCLQIREKATDPWQLHYGEIIGFTPNPGIEYRLRILEDNAPDPPADGSSKRWFLDLVVEQRVVKR